MAKPLRLIFLASFAIIFQCTFGQKMSKKEATKLLEKTITYLKSDDTAAFANMWYFDKTGRPHDNSIFPRQEAIQEFKELKAFIDTALTKNLPFDYVDVENFKSWSKYRIKYKIKAWYKYDDALHYYKGFGFLVDFIDGRWAFRFDVERSISYRDK